MEEVALKLADLERCGNPIGNFCDVWEARPLIFSVSIQVRGRWWQKLVMQTLEASLIVRFSPRDTLVTTDTDSTTVKVGAAGRIPGYRTDRETTVECYDFLPTSQEREHVRANDAWFALRAGSPDPRDLLGSRRVRQWWATR